MLKRIIAASVITTGLSLAALGEVNADNRDDDSYRYSAWSMDNDHRDDRYNKHHASKKKSSKMIVERKIHRRVVDDTLPIRRLLDLDGSYKGYKVKSVAVKIRPNRSYGRVKLLVNGQVVDRERIDNDNWITLRTDDDKTIGRDLKSLQLDVRGKLYIKDIKVTLKRPVSSRRHTNVNHQHRDDVPPKVTVIKTRQVDDPVERLIRLILRDMRTPGGAF